MEPKSWIYDKLKQICFSFVLRKGINEDILKGPREYIY